MPPTSAARNWATSWARNEAGSAMFSQIAYLLIGVVIVQVIISWVNPYAPLAPVFDALTRPFYAIFRRFVPTIGNVDLSPLFVLLVAQILLMLLENLVARLVLAPS